MEDIYLSETVDNNTIFVTPLSKMFYRETGAQGLGGSEGFFICTASNSHPDAGFEVLAKAATADAAEQIFRALVNLARQGQSAAA